MIGTGYPPLGDQYALKLPQDWEVIDDIAVMDPDGWDRSNYTESWSTPITYAEWKHRAGRSTIAMGLRRMKPVVPEMGVCWNRQCKVRHAMTPKCTPLVSEPE